MNQESITFSIHGRDTIGLKKISDFNNVNMTKVVHPDSNWRWYHYYFFGTLDDLYTDIRRSQLVIQNIALDYINLRSGIPDEELNDTFPKAIWLIRSLVAQLGNFNSIMGDNLDMSLLFAWEGDFIRILQVVEPEWRL